MWKTTLYETTKLTLELRDIVKDGVNIWDFEYPSYYEGDAKKAFEQKVIDHYYFRQIGQETVGRWLHMFRTRIREIMPYYIEMYNSVDYMHQLEDPFENVDMLETFEQETTGTASGEATSSNTGKASSEHTVARTDNTTRTEDKEHRFSNTPQGSISNLESYMTEAAIDDNEGTEKTESSETGSSSSETEAGSTGTTSSETAGTMKYTHHRKGNQGVNTFAHDMMELRRSFINVDMMVINELNDLFLGIY